MKRILNRTGETLAESIIALSILAIGITFAGTIMAMSLGNVTSSKGRVLAVNIAREGIEAVRNIRDTNWLKFSGKRRDCWNHLPDTNPDDCDPAAPEWIDPGDYIVYQDETRRWRLRLAETVDAFESSRLYLMDIDTALDTDGDGSTDNDEDIYNHRIAADNLRLENGDDPLGHEHSTESPFKRVISIDYLTNAGASLAESGGVLTAGYNRMVVTSTVTWPASGRLLSVQLKTYLTDYLGREDLND